MIQLYNIFHAAAAEIRTLGGDHGCGGARRPPRLGFHVLESPAWQAPPSPTFDHDHIIVNESQDVSPCFSRGFRLNSRRGRGSAAQSAPEDPVSVSQEDPTRCSLKHVVGILELWNQPYRGSPRHGTCRAELKKVCRVLPHNSPDFEVRGA